MGLRIIGGHLRGKRLHSVPGPMTRPTGNRQRESIFNILSHEVGDSVVLDLFAGTGVLGIEALSRGAKFAVFLDQFKHRPHRFLAILSLYNIVWGLRVNIVYQI